ncbi:MAG: RNA polymerase sigma factor [Acidobacteriota bacterium]
MPTRRRCQSSRLVTQLHYSRHMGTCNPHLSVLTANQFAAAYRGFFHQTVNYLRASGSNAERAEEIAQAAWARGWECREQLRDVSAVQSWVCTIARNLRHMDFRKARTMQNLTETAATIQPDPRPLYLQQILRPLPKPDRSLLLATYIDGRTSGELGAQLGISPVAVRVRVARAKSSVRKYLSGLRSPGRDTLEAHAPPPASPLSHRAAAARAS